MINASKYGSHEVETEALDLSEEEITTSNNLKVGLLLCTLQF